MAKVWSCIPEDTDVLITHTPPLGILDAQDRLGCEDLARRIQELSLKLHVFGHVHVGHGIEKHEKTTFVNACICDIDYRPVQAPIVVEL